LSNGLKIPVFCAILFALGACRQAASEVNEAQQWLVTVEKWQIEEILIDDAPVFKNGKHVPHISGIKFDAYMDWVRFAPNGTFEGHFKDSTNTKKFQWELYPKQNVIALRDTVAKTGGWNIYPRTVYADAFEMETRSGAYDPPRITKVTLKFKKV
jgi:hypothetical protein